MEHYSRGELIEAPLQLSDLPFNNLAEHDLVWMKVRANSRVPNMVSYVKAKLGDKHEHVLWSGSGASALTKTVQSAEMLKKELKELHQLTHCCYRRSVEVWKPKENESLDVLRVNRDVPSIHILLSKTPLNTAHPSYQAPGSPATSAFWSLPSETTTTQTKKPNHRSRDQPEPGADQSLKRPRRRRNHPPQTHVNKAQNREEEKSQAEDLKPAESTPHEKQADPT